MLHIKNLTAGYGKVNVLHGISLDVNERECVALIGANGAGKSTTLRCICGLNEVRSGSIEFLGERLDGMSGHAIVRKGITMCPEGRQVFAEMSVVENLEMGAHVRNDNEQKSDVEKMRQKPFYNKNKKELEFDERVNYWKRKIKEISMAPFNHDNWSMF